MKVNKAKPTVTIGIPAFNEEANILNLLNSLLKQNQKNYLLKEIIVASDNSTDKTIHCAKQANDKRIILIDNKKRVGKNKRVNQIIKKCKGEILVLIDADTIPKNHTTIESLIQPFLHDSKTVYTSGVPEPVKPNTFMGNAIQVGRNVWNKLRDEINDGKGIYTCHGQLYALKSGFAKRNPYPKEMWTDSTFYYFTCLKQRLVYQPAKKAIVLFSAPSTVKDHISQIGRYQNLNNISIKYFGEDIRKEFDIPPVLLYKYKLEAFLRYPIHSLVIFALNLYAKYSTRILKKINSGVWETQSSTKKIIKL